MSARNKSSRRWPAILAVPFLLFLLASPLSARDRRLLKFFSDVDVLPDATVEVTEHITFQFIGGPWHGIIPDIPVRFTRPPGLYVSLFLKVKTVTAQDRV